MDRTVTITLAGRQLPLDDDAYEALKAWLARAEAGLSANADGAEIIADLEDAIAARAAALLADRAAPLGAGEMNALLEAIGPVAGANPPPAADPWSRKLYRVYDDTAWTGVSLGLARWRDLDVGLIRFGWLALTGLTGGAAAIVYALLAVIIPPIPGPEGIKPSKRAKGAGQARRAN